MTLGKQRDGIDVAALQAFLKLGRVEVGANAGDVFARVEIEVNLAKSEKIGTHSGLREGKRRLGNGETVCGELRDSLKSVPVVEEVGLEGCGSPALTWSQRGYRTLPIKGASLPGAFQTISEMF